MTARSLTRPILLLCALLVPRLAAAQVTPASGFTPGDDTQSVRVTATFFGNWTWTKSPKSTDAAGNPFSPNSFDVARAYINILGNISHVVNFRFTPDVSRMTTAGNNLTGSLLYRTKYAFMQMNLDDWTGSFKQSWVRFGIQQTPLIDYEEGVYRYRFQGTMYVERDGGLASSDAGVSFHSNLPNGYGDFHVGVYNGEGYSAAETNQEKAMMVRGSIRPMPMGTAATKGLRLTGFYIADHAVADATKTRGLFSVLYEHRRFNFGAEYLAKNDQPLPTSPEVKSGGYSVFVTPFFKEKGNGPEVLIRYDVYKLNKDLDPERHRAIAGFAYWFPHPGGTSTAALLLDYEQVTEPGTVKQQRVALHALINF